MAVSTEQSDSRYTFELHQTFLDAYTDPVATWALIVPVRNFRRSKPIQSHIPLTFAHQPPACTSTHGGHHWYFWEIGW